ncbi:MAG: hypothetical protein AABZ55_11695, partial [Bdellovibrionota bacterium]
MKYLFSVNSQRNLFTTVLSLSILISGCGFHYDKVEDTLPASESITGFRFYSNNLYPLLRSKCSSCHETKQSPFFAATSVIQSYLLSKHYLDTNNALRSKIIKQATGGHCGTEGCMIERQPFEALVESWVKEELIVPSPVPSHSPTPDRFVTESVHLPSDLSDQHFVTISWPTRIPDTSIEAEVLYFARAAYLIQKPRVVTTKSSFYVQDLEILLNDQLDTNVQHFKSI